MPMEGLEVDDSDELCSDCSTFDYDDFAFDAAIAETSGRYDYVDELPVVRHFRDLLAWQKAMDLAEAVFSITRPWAGQDQIGLGNQLRRAAVSVPSNIAEGQGRLTNAEFTNRLRIAHGSLREVETQLLLAQRLGLGGKQDVSEALELAIRTGQLILGLIRALNRAKK